MFVPTPRRMSALALAGGLFVLTPVLPFLEAFSAVLPRGVFPGAVLWYLFCLAGMVLLVVRSFRRMSLRFKFLSVSLLLSLVPLLLLSLFSSRIIVAGLHLKIHENLLNAAAQSAAGLDSLLENTLDDVRTAALLPGLVRYLALPPTVREGVREREARAVLEVLCRRDAPHVSSCALLDAAGMNVLDTYARDELPDKSLRPYFVQAMRGGQACVSPVLRSPVTGRPSLFFSSPVRDRDGKILGVLRVRYEADMLQDFLSRHASSRQDRHTMVLLDEHAIRLSDTRHPEGRFVPLLPLEEQEIAVLKRDLRLAPGNSTKTVPERPELRGFVRQLAARPTAMVALYPESSALLHCAGVALRVMPWQLVGAMPLWESMAPIRRHAVLSAVLLLLCAGLVVAGAVTAAGVVAGPLRRLAGLAGKIGEGELTWRATEDSDDEAGRLARALNLMADRLSVSQERVRRQASRLRGLLDTLPDTVLALSADFRIVEGNCRFPRMFGYDPVRFHGRRFLGLSARGVSLADLEDKLRSAVRIGSLSFEWLCRRRDGSEFPVHVRLRLQLGNDALMQDRISRARAVASDEGGFGGGLAGRDHGFVREQTGRTGSDKAASAVA